MCSGSSFSLFLCVRDHLFLYFCVFGIIFFFISVCSGSSFSLFLCVLDHLFLYFCVFRIIFFFISVCSGSSVSLFSSLFVFISDVVYDKISECSLVNLSLSNTSLICGMSGKFWSYLIVIVGLWHLMPLSTIFQLYRGSQFYWWRKKEYTEKTTDLPVPQVTNKFYYNVVSSTPRHEGIRTHNFCGCRHGLHRYLYSYSCIHIWKMKWVT